MVHGAVVVPTGEDGVEERGLTGITASALMYMAWHDALAWEAS
jgi:hypothetical protein